MTPLCQTLPSWLIIWLVALTEVVDRRASFPISSSGQHYCERLQLISRLFLLQPGHYCLNVINVRNCDVTKKMMGLWITDATTIMAIYIYYWTSGCCGLF